jgi:DNA-binding transcriptional regulator YdaS (Cro superfamily)
MRALALFILWTDEVGREKAAELLGCDPSFISHVRSGRKKPSLEKAAALERATAKWKRGPIRAVDWTSTKAA